MAMTKLAERHPTDFWGRDARNAAREERIAAQEWGRDARNSAALKAVAARVHHPEKGRRVERCPSCQGPGFVGSICGCGWQL